MRTLVDWARAKAVNRGPRGWATAWSHGPAVGLLFLALAFSTATGALEAQSTSNANPGNEIGVLDWLSGCWELRSPSRITVERWGDARSDALLGTSQTTSGGRTVSWEFLRIATSASGAITYYAHPSGQAPAVFEATVVTADSIVFANPLHDFPQSITYRRRPDSLLASIGGEDASGPRDGFFPYARIPCDASGGGT